MSFPNKDLRVGDVLVTDKKEVYVYLGFYDGCPMSFYTDIECGHLYVFFNRMDFYYSSLQGRYIDMRFENLEELQRKIKENIKTRIKYSHLDGNGSYTSQYKRFEGRLCHVDLSDMEDIVKSAWGLTWAGEKKPRGFKKPHTDWRD